MAFTTSHGEAEEYGPHRPKKKSGDTLVDKERSEWTMEDKKLVSLNDRAVNILHCALIRAEFDHISTCKSAREIWCMLELKHEGTSQVKDTKINMLVHDYELFKMKPNECISDMFARLTTICNELQSLGKVYSNADRVQKVLRSLPKTWKDKVTAIQEAKDLQTLKLEELIGSLMTHEIELKKYEEEDETPRRKGIALAANSDSSSDEDEETQIARNFRKCGKTGHLIAECPKPSKKKFKGKGKKEKKAFKATWDNTSSDGSSSEEEEDHTAKLCLMAKSAEVSSSQDEVVSVSESQCFDSLSDAYAQLCEFHESLMLKYKLAKKEISRLKKIEKVHLHDCVELKTKHDDLDITCNDLAGNIDDLVMEIEALKEHTCQGITDLQLQKLREFDEMQERVKELDSEILSWEEYESKMLDKLTNLKSEVENLNEKNQLLEMKFSQFCTSSEKLDLLFSSQRHYLDKSGIGYDPMKLNESLSGTSAMGRTSIVAAQRAKLLRARVSHPRPGVFKLKRYWVCLKTEFKSGEWYLDSGCSRHMTGNPTMFTTFTKKKHGGNITFGDNSKGRILGNGSVGNSSFAIDGVLYVSGLSFNLISISQLADKGFVVKFKKDKYLIKNKLKELVVAGSRSGNVYVIDFESLSSSLTCLIASSDCALH
ncbi:uncharacterized protein LOC119994770 [Tripterygium wilfordii]|uniref:uncharacterized protein LOC119994768 n=1 Tax=Tripterygium wilfordii TaxID=458696 RepID=UPI0018F80D58|nr:uncharacterized protein LOC119994768 [Tripterygium wilfordii]XP_038697187.1 uncharacterized protein LOC119994769 [Tripterygium wilfordii]XP_038697188.1 uncharacterized protein LOC119994770 [Tripterygium wilfordii]